MDGPKIKPATFWDDLRLAWSFRSFFLPFLLRAACLLLMAFVQATLLFGSTTASQRVIDSLTSGLGGAAIRAPTRILGFAVDAGTPISLALLMTSLLVASAVIGIFAEQLRIGLSQRFRVRIQRELLRALTLEPGETRAQRQTGETIKIFVNRAFSGGERRASERSDRLSRQSSARTARFFELVGRLVYFGGERKESTELLHVASEAGNANRKFALISSTRAAAAGIVTTLSLPLIVILLAQGVAPVTPGTIVQTQNLLALLLMSISSLAATPLVIAGSSPAMRQIRKVLDIPKPGPAPAELAELAARSDPASLRLTDVTFNYSGATKPVLTGLTVEIPAGTVVGITGRSGCGKSTLGKLLNGDLSPVNGSIYVDGVDIAHWHLVWKRELVGFLPTGFEFLNGTLEENILIGRERRDVEHFDDALRLSGVAKFLEEEGLTLQHPIRSLSGEGSLSFGQRRRVGIAQLLCGKQRILVFDEPGASLDPGTMSTVAANLREAVRGRTTLIITHDPDIFQTDFNLFIRNGAIADIGPHLELMRRNSDYFELLNKNIEERRRA